MGIPNPLDENRITEIYFELYRVEIKSTENSSCFVPNLRHCTLFNQQFKGDIYNCFESPNKIYKDAIRMIYFPHCSRPVDVQNLPDSTKNKKFFVTSKGTTELYTNLSDHGTFFKDTFENVFPKILRSATILSDQEYEEFKLVTFLHAF